MKFVHECFDNYSLACLSQNKDGCERCESKKELKPFRISWGFTEQDLHIYVLCRRCTSLIEKAIKEADKKRKGQ